jgi:TM2 domain-containing membrane protein YozV
MSNRKKARLVALICLLLLVPGLHRFYMGDTTLGILILLSSVLYISLVVAIIDIVRFYIMSDEEFDSKYTVGFKMKPVNSG